MKKQLIFTKLFLTAAALFAVSAQAQTAAPSADIASKVDEYMNARLDAKGMGGSVLIMKDGKPLAAKGYGLADIEGNKPIAHDTKFRIGSVNKQFTAALVLLLQEKGKLSVQDPVCKYFDPCPEAWKPVTLHHLLSMTSGITNLTTLPKWRSELRFKDLKPAESIALVSGLPLKTVPGEVYEYSNSNYIILGTIIEKVSGKSYEEFLTEKIIKPLKLKNTGMDDGKTKLPNSALGYDQKDGKNVPAEPASVVIPFSAGSMYSTVGDLYTWQNALLNGRVFKNKATLDAMLTPNKKDYAYGLMIVTDRKGRKRITHGGGIEGFLADTTYFPADDLFIAALTNHQRGGIGEMTETLTAIAYGEPFTVPKKRIAVKVEPAVLDAYVGTYQLAPVMALKIERGPDGLTIEPTGQPKASLFAESDSEFFLTIVDATLKFLKDDSGKVTGLEFSQSGRTMKAPKVE